MTTDPDPFEEGQRAARKNIPAEANPYRDGTGNIRFGQPAMKELPAWPKLTNPRGLELPAALSRSS
jgi:hypothetical protein